MPLSAYKWSLASAVLPCQSQSTRPEHDQGSGHSNSGTGGDYRANGTEGQTTPWGWRIDMSKIIEPHILAFDAGSWAA